MESLLCNEVWLMNSLPSQEDADDHAKSHALVIDSCLFCSSKQDFEQVFGIFLEKELTYMPQTGYSKLLNSNSFVRSARFKAVSSLLGSQRRMNLSSCTVFSAVNYLDRFISSTRDCREWKSWKFDLLSIACLSVASKFNEANTCSLHEFQLVTLQQDSFASDLIQQMELILLKTLGWRMDCTTSLSYIELLMCSIDSLNKTLLKDLTSHVTQLLLDALLDCKLLEFRPSVIAMSAVSCIYETNTASIAHLNAIIPPKHMDDLIKCQKMMKKLWFKDHQNVITSENSLSPVTVLKVEWYNGYDYRVDLSLLKMPMVNINLESIRKRNREEPE